MNPRKAIAYKLKEKAKELAEELEKEIKRMNIAEEEARKDSKMPKNIRICMENDAREMEINQRDARVYFGLVEREG